jgi:Tfp pilus assembly protein PilV
MAELLVALLFVSIALFGYIALQMRLIDSNEKLVSKQTALQEAEVKLAQSVTGFRRDHAPGFPALSPTIAETSWTDRNGAHHYRVDTLTCSVRAGW